MQLPQRTTYCTLHPSLSLTLDGLEHQLTRSRWCKIKFFAEFCFNGCFNLLNQSDFITLLKFLNLFSDNIFSQPINDQCSLSYRDQPIDLKCKSIDWFLYDGEHFFYHYYFLYFNLALQQLCITVQLTPNICLK